MYMYSSCSGQTGRGEKNELPQVGLEPTILYTLDRALYH